MVLVCARTRVRASASVSREEGGGGGRNRLLQSSGHDLMTARNHRNRGRSRKIVKAAIPL